MGGIAIAGAIGLGLSVGGPGVFTWPVWVGAGLLLGLGLADDLWSVRPDAKVIAQVLAGMGVLYAGFAFWQGGPVWVSFPLTFLWVIGISNALNLIDGIDGLAASVTAIAAGTLALLSFALGNLGVATVMLVLVGAATGFLFYNAPPASVFMGDCGSLVLGYLLSVGALSLQGGGSPVIGTLVPVAVLAVPIFDTTFVTLTRLLRGQPVTDGGTDHVHHRLIKLGASDSEALLLLSGASAAFGVLALSALWMQIPLFLAVAVLCLVTVAVLGIYLGTMEGKEEVVLSTSLGARERVVAFLRTYVGGAFWKSVVGVLADLLVVGAAFVVAIHLRYGGDPPPDWVALMTQVLPGVVGIKLLVFYAVGLYKGIWRHAGTSEGVRLVGASVIASLFAGVGVVIVGDLKAAAFSVFILDWMVATIGIGGTRFAFRALRQFVAAHREDGRPVFVYGSRTDSLLLLRYLRHHTELGRSVVGLLDDDPNRHGYWVQGVEVIGAPEALPHLSSEHGVEEVIIPVQAVSEDERRRIRDQCVAASADCTYFAPTLRPASEEDALAPGENGHREAVSSSS
ncbi:hypothetical protein [Salinibacter ruber]|uniref:hypothetical protein n=1 Tax=Salinibacter ruber TaxID=146919 RepID=UPI0021683211|nr:hypothetical protein [Salinibacter ruber]